MSLTTKPPTQLGVLLGAVLGVVGDRLLERHVARREDRGVVDEGGQEGWHRHGSTLVSPGVRLTSVAYYRSVGDVPRTRHTAFRDEAGQLRYEELMGEEGFSSDSSLLYHRGVPSAIVDSQVWELPDLATTPNHPLKPRHLKLHDVPTDGDPGHRAAPRPRQRRRADQLRRHRRGAPPTTATPSVTSASTSSAAAAPSRPSFGVLSYRTGDYVVIPRATTHRWRPERGERALRHRGQQPHLAAQALPLPLRAVPRARAVLRARPARSRRAARRGRHATSRCSSSTAATARPAWSAPG